MMNQTKFTLVNPLTKTAAFQLYTVEDAASFSAIQRNQYYTVILVSQGKGTLHAGVTQTEFEAGCMLSLSLYDPYRIDAENFSAVIIEFHPEFFCIYKHEEEVASNGVLFNNIYQSPVITLTAAEMILFLEMMIRIRSEMQETGVSQYEMLTAYSEDCSYYRSTDQDDPAEDGTDS